MKVLRVKSVIIPLFITAGLIAGQTVSYAYHPEKADKTAGGKKAEQKIVKKQEKYTSAIEKIKDKADQAVGKLTKITAKKESKKAPKEKIREDKGKVNQAKQLKAEKPLKENKGRQNAFRNITDKLSDSTRHVLKGLQNALDAISKWFGMDRAIDSGQKYNQKLQDQK